MNQENSGREAKKILIVAPGIPHPERGASTVLFYYYIEAFRRSGHEVLLLLLLSDDGSSEERLREFSERISPSERFTVLPCRANRFVTSTRFFHVLQRQAIDPVRKAVEAFGANALFALDVNCAWAGLEFDVPYKVAWLGDLHFRTYWYNALYSWKEGTARPWHLIWALFQCISWKRVYGRVLRRFDRVIVSSKSSAPALARLGIGSKYLPYPWPNDCETKPPRIPPNTVPTFLFFGTLQALGSRSALNFIIRKIYPLAKTEFGANGFRIKICGAGKFSAWAERQLAEKPEIEFLGFVDDLGTLFSQCHAVIAPIDTPIGNRSRILTAMANRLLVIAHENTALGNPDLVDGRTCFLAKTPVQFVSKMRQATNAGGFAEILKDRALAVYQTKFAPEQAVTALMKEAFDTTAF